MDILKHKCTFTYFSHLRKHTYTHTHTRARANLFVEGMCELRVSNVCERSLGLVSLQVLHDKSVQRVYGKICAILKFVVKIIWKQVCGRSVCICMCLCACMMHVYVCKK